tara:strand:- start:926 stop:1549 length:624 start_codon:yes stop_codon:yes gene_type:complete
MLTFFGKAYSEISYGVSLAFTEIDASGTETEGGEQTNASASNSVVIPSVFVEYAYTDVISVGLDFIPLKADVSNKTKSRSDTETSVSGTATTTSTARTNKAQAELENHTTLYANYMFNDEYFVKAGVAYVSLNTEESLGTGSKYGNDDIFGGVIGVGAKTGNHRFELIYTDYEDISLTSSVARTGVTTNNKIDADLDTIALKYSYAF